MSESSPSNGRFLKLTPNFLLLWVALWFIVGTKVFLIRGTSAADMIFVGVFGVLLLVIPYLVAWIVWRVADRKQLTGEIAYLAVSAIVFLIPTIDLYRYAIANR